jgi:hypothetical protein
MKTLTIGIALATLICSPAFATPVDAVTAGAALYAAIGMAGVSGMMRHTPNQFSQTEQTSRLQREGAAAGVDRSARARPSWRPAWRWSRPSRAPISTRRAVGA